MKQKAKQKKNDMDKKELQWNDVWLPEYTSDGCYIWATDKDGALVMMFDIDYEDRFWDEAIGEVLAVMNGKSDKKLFCEALYKDIYLILDGHSLVVRGWGHLTAPGGLGLSEKEAIRLQDSMRDWFLKKMVADPSAIKYAEQLKVN